MKIALRTTVIYWITGVAWILFGDLFLDKFQAYAALSQAALNQLEVLKGLAYVSITGGLLYSYIFVNISRIKQKESEAEQVKKQLYDEIKRQKYNLKILFDSSSDNIWSLDKNYRLISANAAFLTAFQKLFGREVREGDNMVSELFDPALRAEWKEYYDETFNGSTIEITREIPFPGQQPQIFEYRFFPVYDTQNQCVGVSCYGHNITERQVHLQKIREQNEQLMQVAWIQSHKLRVPVAQILGLVSIFNPQKPEDPINITTITKLREVAENLDIIVHEIVEATVEIRDGVQEINF